MSFVEDLQGVLNNVIAALESEDQNDCFDAVQNLGQAQSRLAYLMSQPGFQQLPALLTEICKGLLETYHLRIQDLNTKAAAWTATLPGTGTALHHTAQVTYAAATEHQQCSTDSNDDHSSVDDYHSATAAHQAPPQHILQYAGGPLAQAQKQYGIQTSAHHRLHKSHVHPNLEAAESSGACTEQLLDILRACQCACSGSLDDIAGLESLKQEIRQAIFLPLKLPHLFKGLRKPPRNWLLYGPPGTGKTAIVTKIAAEAQMTLLALSPSSILSKWSGESEKTLRAAFEAAKAMQPSILFIDEIDSLASQRSAGDEISARRLLTELLVLMTGAADRTCSLYIFAATNRMQDCDTALLRRFDRRVHVPLPDAAGRKAFFQLMLQRPEMSSTLQPLDVDLLVERTQGYSGSDLALVCKEAAMEPVRELCSDPSIQQLLLTAPVADLMGCSSDQDVTDAMADTADMVSEVLAGKQPGAAATMRRLAVEDFLAALDRVRPAAEDQASGMQL